MKKLVMVLLLVGLPPALAQGTPDLLKQARELEKRASALLDQDKRAEAFDLLARAAKLRERVRLAAKKGRKTAAPAPRAKAKAKPKAKPRPKAKRGHKPRDLRPIQHHVEAAFQQMDRAMQAGDMAAFRKAANQSRALLSRWATGLQAQEKKIIARTPQAVAKRVARLERQVKELAKLLDSLSR